MNTTSQSATAEPCVYADNRLRFLCGGIDWLELSSPYMLCADVLDALAKGQEQARAEEGGSLIDIRLIFRHDDGPKLATVTVEVAPYSIGKGFVYTFRTDEMIVHARAVACKLETMPNILVKITNEALHQRDWRETYEQAEAMLSAMCGLERPSDGSIELNISRVDVYLDCQGIDLASIGMEQWVGQPRAQIAQFRAGSCHTGFAVTPTSKAQDDWSLATGRPVKNRGAKDEGLYVGRSGGIRFRIYDKCQEISASSGKVWMYDKWAKCEEFDSETVNGKTRARVPVIRCEWQLRREKLNEFNGPDMPRGIRTVAQLDAALPQLWAYLTGSPVVITNRNRELVERPGWIRLTIPRWSRTGGLKRVTTWPESKLWTQIREWGSEGFEAMRRTPLVAVRKAESLYPQASGVAASVAARYAILGDLDPNKAVEFFASPDAWDEKLDAAAGRILSEIESLAAEGERLPPDRQLARAVELVLKVLRRDGKTLLSHDAGHALLDEMLKHTHAGPRADHRSRVGHIRSEQASEEDFGSLVQATFDRMKAEGHFKHTESITLTKFEEL